MTAVEWYSQQHLKLLIKLENKELSIGEYVVQHQEILHKSKEMEKKQSFVNANRVEVIQHSEPYNGRAYTNYNAKDVEVQLQDDGKTLKIFLK